MTTNKWDDKQRPFQFSLRTLIIVLIITSALMIACCLPIWHRHSDLRGQMHGHPIWGFNHYH